jgi:hypothetical protein
MTPRYLKAQRVYSPTPLATLQKLSITLETPDGSPLTSTLDTVDISRIYLAGSITTSLYATDPDDVSYIFIATKLFFSRFAVAEGDTIQIRGYDVGTSIPAQLQNDFNSFINRTDGHVVVGTGHGPIENATNAGSVAVADAPNSVGYCNFIVIRSRFIDPTTGLATRNYFGGDNTLETTVLKPAMDTLGQSTNAAALNRNRQSHFTIRVITREMDYGSNVRPDNT